MPTVKQPTQPQFGPAEEAFSKLYTDVANYKKLNEFVNATKNDAHISAFIYQNQFNQKWFNFAARIGENIGLIDKRLKEQLILAALNVYSFYTKGGQPDDTIRNSIDRLVDDAIRNLPK